MSSLPTPVSPRMSAPASVGATRSTPYRGLVDRGFLRKILQPGKDDRLTPHHLPEAPRQVASSPHLRKRIQPGDGPRVRHDKVIPRSLKEGAAVEAERLDDAPQAILDRVIHVLGIDVDESRGEIDDQRLEAEAFPTLEREVALLHIRRKRVRRYYVHAQSPARGRIKGM